MSAYDEPTKGCPYCGAEMEADWVDVGVGVVQCGPYHCDGCYASEIGPEGSEGGATDEELKVGFYQGKISPYANTVNGNLVDHKTAKAAYDIGLLDDKNI